MHTYGSGSQRGGAPPSPPVSPFILGTGAALPTGQAGGGGGGSRYGSTAAPGGVGAGGTPRSGSLQSQMMHPMVAYRSYPPSAATTSEQPSGTSTTGTGGFTSNLDMFPALKRHYDSPFVAAGAAATGPLNFGGSSSSASSYVTNATLGDGGGGTSWATRAPSAQQAPLFHPPASAGGLPPAAPYTTSSHNQQANAAAYSYATSSSLMPSSSSSPTVNVYRPVMPNTVTSAAPSNAAGGGPTATPSDVRESIDFIARYCRGENLAAATTPTQPTTTVSPAVGSASAHDYYKQVTTPSGVVLDRDYAALNWAPPVNATSHVGAASSDAWRRSDLALQSTRGTAPAAQPLAESDHLPSRQRDGGLPASASGSIGAPAAALSGRSVVSMEQGARITPSYQQAPSTLSHGHRDVDRDAILASVMYAAPPSAPPPLLASSSGAARGEPPFAAPAARPSGGPTTDAQTFSGTPGAIRSMAVASGGASLPEPTRPELRGGTPDHRMKRGPSPGTMGLNDDAGFALTASTPVQQPPPPRANTSAAAAAFRTTPTKEPNVLNPVVHIDSRSTSVSSQVRQPVAPSGLNVADVATLPPPRPRVHQPVGAGSVLADLRSLPHDDVIHVVAKYLKDYYGQDPTESQKGIETMTTEDINGLSQCFEMEVSRVIQQWSDRQSKGEGPSTGSSMNTLLVKPSPSVTSRFPENTTYGALSAAHQREGNDDAVRQSKATATSSSSNSVPGSMRMPKPQPEPDVAGRVPPVPPRQEVNESGGGIPPVREASMEPNVVQVSEEPLAARKPIVVTMTSRQTSRPPSPTRVPGGKAPVTGLIHPPITRPPAASNNTTMPTAPQPPALATGDDNGIATNQRRPGSIIRVGSGGGETATAGSAADANKPAPAAPTNYFPATVPPTAVRQAVPQPVATQAPPAAADGVVPGPATASQPAPPTVPSHHRSLKECMRLMREGGVLAKYGRNSQPKLRFFNIRDKTMTLGGGEEVLMPHLCWSTDAGSHPSGAVPLLHLTTVVAGPTKPNFKRNGQGAVVGVRNDVIKPTMCMTLEFEERPVDVYCLTQEDYDLWFQGMSLVRRKNVALSAAGGGPQQQAPPPAS